MLRVLMDRQVTGKLKLDAKITDVLVREKISACHQNEDICGVFDVFGNRLHSEMMWGEGDSCSKYITLFLSSISSSEELFGTMGSWNNIPRNDTEFLYWKYQLLPVLMQRAAEDNMSPVIFEVLRGLSACCHRAPQIDEDELGNQWVPFCVGQMMDECKIYEKTIEEYKEYADNFVRWTDFQEFVISCLLSEIV